MSDTMILDEGEIEADTAVPTGGSDSDILNGVGSTTNEYNDTDGNANGTTYIETDLGRADDCIVRVHTQDAALSTSAVGVLVAEARPAQPGDFNSDSDYVDGTIIFTLVDEDGSGEISDDTAIDGNNLEFSYVAVRE